MRQANSSQKPDGYDELDKAYDKLDAVASRNRNYESDGQWERCDRPAETTARETVAQLVAQYPAARLWIKAEQQRDHSHWADNTGRISAAEKALSILNNGGSVEDAEAALAERKEAGAGF